MPFSIRYVLRPCEVLGLIAIAPLAFCFDVSLMAIETVGWRQPVSRFLATLMTAGITAYPILIRLNGSFPSLSDLPPSQIHSIDLDFSTSHPLQMLYTLILSIAGAVISLAALMAFVLECIKMCLLHMPVLTLCSVVFCFAARAQQGVDV